MFARKASGNYRKPIFALKCDIKKFFDSIDQKILTDLLEGKILDDDTLWLVRKIIGSFEKIPGKGLPLGNVTSQLFANIYLNELDQFVKRRLKIKYYLRYCDDFIVLSDDKENLPAIVETLKVFLKNILSLDLHEKKIVIRKFTQGIDFLGYVALPHHRIVRTKTKRRIFRKLSQRKLGLCVGKIAEDSFRQSLHSYRGVLSHANGFKLKEKLDEFK